ncbi:uncharacterized protein [Bemisia tabaci]|uniref:uncharacterized protein n=1 Tax=Bemisia tabaci TaxID=7038 RepID=UPI003B27DC0E
MKIKLLLRGVICALSVNMAWTSDYLANWQWKNLRWLNRGHDPCRRIGEAATGNNTHIVKYVHEMCGGYLRFFHMTPPEYHEHCPGAHEPKCMYHEKKWCCTVKINHRKLADPKPKDFKIVALTSCLATINNWDELVEQEVVTTEKDNYENLYN